MRGYQVRDSDLTAEQRAHLNGTLFPLIRDLKRKIASSKQESRHAHRPA